MRAQSSKIHEIQ